MLEGTLDSGTEPIQFVRPLEEGHAVVDLAAVQVKQADSAEDPVI